MSKTVKLAKVNKSNGTTLESGRKISLKPLTIDLRDDLLDGVEFVFGDDGNVKSVVAPQKTITKWLRSLLAEGTSDEELLEWSQTERTEAFVFIQGYLSVGEEKAST